MTAQIGIYNKKAVVLATDSAVTLNVDGREKIFNSAEKLFELIPGAPVGIMIYNNAEFMQLPWDILIRQYRKDRGDIRFNTINEYRDDFISFIREKDFKTELFESDIIINVGKAYFQKIIDNTISEIESRQINRALTKEEMDEILIAKARDYKEYLEKEELHYQFESIYKNNTLDQFNDPIKESIILLAGNLKEEYTVEICDIIKLAVCSNDFCGNFTGIVITGYGENEILPKTRELLVEFIYGDALKFKELEGIDITTRHSASVIAYAQSDMATTFINGINPYISDALIKMMQGYLYSLELHFDTIKEEYCSEKGIEINEPEELSDIIKHLGQALYTTFDDEISDMQRNISAPFMDMVSSLNKEELAELSESLVHLTSLKRKVSLDAESVGGPVDVAIITKGEGFIWIKRKLYFDKKLNPFYNERKRREFYEN